MNVDNSDIIQYRTMLFSIAYNMLGSIADAEDMVHETFTSWLASDKHHVQNVKFYLIRAISNKCISRLNYLRRKRETYIGTWLPEPIFSSSETDNEETNGNLSIGFLYLLEKLSPIERGVIILKEAFEISYKEISEIFEITEESCRQHCSRAKKKLQEEKKRFKVNSHEHEKIMLEFIDAFLSKDLKKLVVLLRDDVTAYADGGGKAPAVNKPMHGKENLTRLLFGGFEFYKDFRLEVISVNGFESAAFYKTKENTPTALIAIDLDDYNKISSVFYIVNPDKLKNLNSTSLN